MRTLFLMAMLAGALVATGSQGQAMDPCSDGGQTAATASQQPQWFNGQWWYWAGDRGWLVWSNQNWVARADGAPSRRVFSYAPGTYVQSFDPFNAATAGNPTSDAIMRSWGLRSGRSKALADYR
jgi:hypothetical protein